MTNQLEKQFFDTFGIKPEIFTGCKLEKNNWKEDTCPFEKDGIMELCHKVCKYAFTEREIYPQITDRILLELICILSCWHLDEREPYEITSINIEQLKNQILSDSLYIAKHAKAKHKVRILFGENND
ncbi:MAG: hypothetical protein IKY94_06555 [Lachnospiraceae bacterium]|nr:hypothetical protein [Clostridia bacterium]MBR4982201.1 hypothetical protein [Lachnospiraceae bacterium]